VNSEQSYSIVNNILRSRIVVDIDCDAAQGSYFGRELGEARVVLALALIGVRHGGGLFLKVQIAEESLRGHNSEGPSLPPQLLGSPGCWGRECSGQEDKARMHRIVSPQAIGGPLVQLTEKLYV